MYVYSEEVVKRVKRKGKVKLEEEKIDRCREEREKENGGKREENKR